MRAVKTLILLLTSALRGLAEILESFLEEENAIAQNDDRGSLSPRRKPKSHAELKSLGFKTEEEYYAFLERSGETEQEYYERVNYIIIGDGTCKHNARNPRLRCAINPSGPCEGCEHFDTGWTPEFTKSMQERRKEREDLESWF